MLYAINIFGFFKDISQQRFNNADFVDYLVSFKNDSLPPFIALIESISDDIIVDLYSINRNSKKSSVVLENISDLTITTSGSYKVLKFVYDNTENEFTEGYYFYKVTIGGVSYYSEVFCLASVLDKLCKFSFSSSDILFNNTVVLPFYGIQFDFYLKYNDIFLTHEVPTDDGFEKNYGDIPYFSTVVLGKKVDINGTEQIYAMLAYLRALMVNGEVYITIKGIESKIYSFEIEASSMVDDTVIITINYKEFNYISSMNAI